MSFFSFWYLLALCLVLMAWGHSRASRYRRLLLGVVNAAFVATAVGTPTNGLGLVVFLAVGYGMVWLVQRRPSPLWVPFFSALVILVLVVTKRYQVIAGLLPAWILEHPLEVVGLSYMSFKLIHLLVDAAQGQLSRVAWWPYLNYQAGFYCLLAGPIQRYPAFASWWDGIDTEPETRREGLLAWSRMLTGMIKFGVAGALTLHVFDLTHAAATAAGERWLALGNAAVAFYAYPAYVYLNFAGYCDIVIGSALLLGLRQPENFDRPYLARNVLDFWNRWHITLTHWIRDYVFTTSYKWVATHWSRYASIIGYGLMFTALFLAGMWHGPGRNFIVFGALHGVGVASAQMYGDFLRRRLGRQRFKAYLANRWFRLAGIAVTFNYVCFTFLFFRPGVRDTLVWVRDVAAHLR